MPSAWTALLVNVAISASTFSMSSWNLRITFNVSPDEFGIEALGVQQQQRAGPVDGLRDRRHLLEIEIAEFLDEGHQLPTQFRRDVGHPGMDDALFKIGIREWNVEMETAALQRVGDLTRVVARQEDDGRFTVRLDGADLGNRHLEVGEDFQEQRFELVIGLVHLVEQQHAAVLFPQRLQERSRL